MKKQMEHSTKQRELDIFRKTLWAKHAELSDGHRCREALAIETSADEVDRIQHAQELDFAIGELDRVSIRLREIRAALERIESGSFGICLNCEEEIGLKRLAAVPWTALCIDCQEAAELISSGIKDDEHRLWNAA